MANKKPKQGGKREGAGRKKLPTGEKKITVNLYVQEKHIEKVGGYDKAQQIGEAAIVRQANKK